jgi:hypothetical protein
MTLLLFVIFSNEVCIGQNLKHDNKNADDGIAFPYGSSAYIIAIPQTPLQKKVALRLSDYLSKVLDKPAKIVTGIEQVPANTPAIILSPKYAKSLLLGNNKVSTESFILETKSIGTHKVVLANGSTELGLKHAVQKLIIKSEQRSLGLVIPELHLAESPWIAKREWAVCPWSPNLVRGVFTNPNADKRQNIWLYSDKQIANYVDMFDAFGFSGCQLLESASSYGVMGSPEAFRGRLKQFANSIKSNGQNVTLWVWAAQFNNYGWVDNDVTYTPQQGKSAFEDNRVRASFEKYYNGYAEMAPYTDLLITHFYDPGSLKKRPDVFNYMHLLQDKFKAINPKVQFAVDFWASDSDSAYMKQLIANGFGNSLLLESGMPHLYPPGKREELHNEAKRQGLKMGIWGWHTVERETDQFPNMHVNAEVLSNFYRQIRDGVDKIHPVQYWSEMEAYHLCNIFSMYASSQLLWNPDKDPNELLKEISEGIWGPVNGPKVLRALLLIQDTRSGPTWDTYWSHKDRQPYCFGTKDPSRDKSRAEAVLNDFSAMKTDTAFVVKFPLPFPPSTFVELMVPHIRQIMAFADFRIKEKMIRETAKKGASKDELILLCKEAWQPVPEYNTWIGTFGQAEARVQETMMRQLAKDIGVEINPPSWMVHRDADRFLERIQTLQMRSSQPVQFKPDDAIGKGEFYWPAEKINECIDILFKVGSLEKVADNIFRLSNWENFRKQSIN